MGRNVYQHGQVPRFPNASDDARVIAEGLTSLGTSIEKGCDAIADRLMDVGGELRALEPLAELASIAKAVERHG